MSKPLANGVPILELGDRIEPSTLTQIYLPTRVQNHNQPISPSPILCTGNLQYIDGFGNLISHIPQQFVPTDLNWEIQIDSLTGPQRFPGIETYAMCL